MTATLSSIAPVTYDEQRRHEAEESSAVDYDAGVVEYRLRVRVLVAGSPDRHVRQPEGAGEGKGDEADVALAEAGGRSWRGVLRLDFGHAVEVDRGHQLISAAFSAP